MGVGSTKKLYAVVVCHATKKQAKALAANAGHDAVVDKVCRCNPNQSAAPAVNCERVI
jgi:hypothetical protein